jgi:pre-rRNA-processing protein TSR2
MKLVLYIKDEIFFFQVAEKLMIMHEECLEGNYSSIQKLREAAPRTRAHQHVKQVIMV